MTGIFLPMAQHPLKKCGTNRGLLHARAQPRSACFVAALPSTYTRALPFFHFLPATSTKDAGIRPAKRKVLLWRALANHSNIMRVPVSNATMPVKCDSVARRSG